MRGKLRDKRTTNKRDLSKRDIEERRRINKRNERLIQWKDQAIEDDDYTLDAEDDEDTLISVPRDK